MIDLATYKLLHLIGVFFIVMSFGALIFRSCSRAEAGWFSKRKLSVIHGLGMLISGVAGFGMLARLGLGSAAWPDWVWIKFFIWLTLGFLIAAVNRVPSKSVLWWWFILVLAATAAYIGLNHRAIGS